MGKHSDPLNAWRGGAVVSVVDWEICGTGSIPYRGRSFLLSDDSGLKYEPQDEANLLFFFFLLLRTS